MPTLAERYRGPADLPQRIPVFPLRRAILLPRATLPLNVFEPRYLAMLDDVMSGSRVLAIVQPAARRGGGQSPAGSSADLRRVGCVGRVTSYQEIDDGRLIIALTGIARCDLVGEVAAGQALPHLRPSLRAFPAAISSPAAARTTSTASAFSQRSRPTWRRADSEPTGRRFPSPRPSRWSTRWRSPAPTVPRRSRRCSRPPT